jgi:dUTP pyrophosphatase
MTEPQGNLPPMAEALQKAGYDNSISTARDIAVPINDINLKVQLLSDMARAPERSTPDSAGLDLYSTIDGLVHPHSHIIIPTDIAIEPIKGTYGHICTRSSMASKGLSVLGGVVDQDYRGNIKVILQNNSKEAYEIQKGQSIAQLVLKQIWKPVNVDIVTDLTTTERGAAGFGSTEMRKAKQSPVVPLPTPPTDIPMPESAAAATTTAVTNEFDFCSNPFENEIEIIIDNTGTHPTRGMDVTFCDKFEKVQLIACEKGTPAGRIDK